MGKAERRQELLRAARDVFATKAFHEANPKTVKAYLGAVAEACETITKDRKGAIELYVKASGDKTPVGELDEILSDPALRYTLQPTGTRVFAEFMHKTGTIKTAPASQRKLV